LLPRSNGWILERPINGFPYYDAMGCYPLFVCEDWSQLNADLEQVGKHLVCLSLVTDPFGEWNSENLHQWFPELVIPFKQHFVIDLSQAPETFITSHHRRNVRKALQEVRIEECADPVSYLDDWMVLYQTLVKRHTVTGMAAFSRESLAGQLSVPGTVAFRALHHDATVGMLLWCGQGNRSYYHLGAYSPLGYELGASFALFDYSIKYFAEREFRWLNLGAEAGAAGGDSGLRRFKQGWSTGTRTVYFCGRVFDRTKYEEIILAKGVPPTNYFPAYRLGEFS
jgi:hypothetical protein